MAFELYANYERFSNNSIFYREISAVPCTINFKIAQPEISKETLEFLFLAKYSLNNGPLLDFSIDNKFETSASFDRTLPCVSSFNAFVYTADGEELVEQISMSAVFVSAFPKANFLAFPSSYIEETFPYTQKFLNFTNYSQTPGLYFYGEGHTEKILLSSASFSNCTPSWFIGNSVADLSSSFSDSVFLATTGFTSYTNISSKIGETASYPISLWLTNNEIFSSGPIVRYDDYTGERVFYPFFASSLNVNNEVVSTTNKLKNNIEIKQYPVSQNDFALVSPFESDLIVLPSDHSTKSFSASAIYSPVTSFVSRNFYGTGWETEAIADSAEPNPDWYNATNLLANVNVYKFPLSYFNQNNVGSALFKASVGFNTSLKLTLSAFQTATLNYPPYDWQPSLQATTYNSQTVIAKLPVSTFYTANYFNLTGVDVRIYNIYKKTPLIRVEKVLVSSDQSSDVICFSGTNLLGSNTMKFSDTGVVTLSVSTKYTDDLNKSHEIHYEVANFIEIVNKYDDVQSTYYRTLSSPLKLTCNESPKISPNEWAVSDNFNSIATKLYTSIDELNNYTKYYVDCSKVFGRIEQEYVPLYKWDSVECSINPESYLNTWNFLQNCNSTENSSHFGKWYSHTIFGGRGDTSCVQKYCTEWKWSSKKESTSDIFATWASTQALSQYSKKWKYEPCVENLNIEDSSVLCKNTAWITSNTNYFGFESWPQTNSLFCEYTGVKYLSKINKIVVSYPTELRLINNDYESIVVANQIQADDVFTFQNIVKVDSTTNGQIVVLDSILSRISVFSVTSTGFGLYTSWGRYGLVNNTQGTNNPSDLCVGINNTIWIADTGNKCVKKYTLMGKPLLTITHEQFETNYPLSVCIDSQDNLHVLLNDRILVFNQNGEYLFEYLLTSEITKAKKIVTNYNKEIIYVTHLNGVAKYFRTGSVALSLLTNFNELTGFSSIDQDEYRNTYVTVRDLILKVADLMKVDELNVPSESLKIWSLSDVLINKEEFIQPYVFLRSFHRLWDNIEVIKNSLFYDSSVGCRSYNFSQYTKEDLNIGQNEIVSNAVINRLTNQIWTNLQGLVNYFDPNRDCSIGIIELLEEEEAFPNPPHNDVEPLPETPSGPPIEPTVEGFITFTTEEIYTAENDQTELLDSQHYVTIGDENQIVFFDGDVLSQT